jgi:FixJ family two-component response regulator
MITEAMARKMGIRAFLLKPLRLGDMAEAVKNALESLAVSDGVGPRQVHDISAEGSEK